MWVKQRSASALFSFKIQKIIEIENLNFKLLAKLLQKANQIGILARK